MDFGTKELSKQNRVLPLSHYNHTSPSKIGLNVELIEYQGLNRSIQMHRKRLIAAYDGELYQTFTTKNELCADASKRIQIGAKNETTVSTYI